MAESGPDVDRYRESFVELLESNRFMPGGRIWYGAGRSKGQLLNCFVVPTGDSREGWGRSTSDLMIISGTGGGVGMNFSPIRPRNSIIHGTGGTATGAVSLMRIKNAVGEELKAGGGRRVAMMHALGLSHPDLEEFLDAKLDKRQLNNANVSVIFDEDPEAFFQKVRNGEDWDLRFGGKVHKRVSARAIWERIVANALGDGTEKNPGGEPGLLNGYFANKMSNVWYYAPLLCTNPCGEIWLPAYDCCDLGALVLPRFVRGDSLDWQALSETIALSVRFLDDVLTVNNYPLTEIKEVATSSRRIGLGVMGLDTMLKMLGYRYDSVAALEFVDKLMNTIKVRAYEASIDLAREKGPFARFDAEKFLRSGFCKTLKPSLRERIRKDGIRNCALLTIAPTGTTAMICDVDSGIEPSFGPGHVRKFRDGDDLKSEIVIHPLFQKMVEEGRDTSHFVSGFDMGLRDHFEMQRVCQRHLDNACAKTINLRPGTNAAQLSDLYQEFFPELKGVTVYPDQSREDQPINPISIEQARAHVQARLASGSGPLSADACRLDGGGCG
jgi:ribonucleoside-diphosphate reductase alpha chain